MEMLDAAEVDVAQLQTAHSRAIELTGFLSRILALVQAYMAVRQQLQEAMKRVRTCFFHPHSNRAAQLCQCTSMYLGSRRAPSAWRMRAMQAAAAAALLAPSLAAASTLLRWRHAPL